MAHGRLLFLLSLIFIAEQHVHCAIRDVDSGPPEEQEPGDVSDISGLPRQQIVGPDEGSGVTEATAEYTDEDDDKKRVELTLGEKMRWVTNSKENGVYEASLSDAEGFVSRVGLRESSQRSLDCESGQELKSPSGVLYDLDNDVIRDKDDFSGDKEPTNLFSSSSHFKPLDTSRYPGFATGLLKSKNCTAFLIGRFSALTLAECVYDKTTQQWAQNLDLWRGRNCHSYISLMKWESVTIPRLYFTNEDDNYTMNWAYIKYEEASASDNWIGLSVDCHLSHQADVHVTLSGYPDRVDDDIIGCPHQSSCLLLGKMNQIFCAPNLSFAFPGSPLVAAPENCNQNFVGMSPRLYGIAAGVLQPSVNKVTMITEEMFWLLYDLMDKYRDKPKCTIRDQEWFINRVIIED